MFGGGLFVEFLSAFVGGLDLGVDLIPEGIAGGGDVFEMLFGVAGDEFVLLPVFADFFGKFFDILEGVSEDDEFAFEAAFFDLIDLIAEFLDGFSGGPKTAFQLTSS